MVPVVGGAYGGEGEGVMGESHPSWDAIKRDILLMSAKRFQRELDDAIARQAREQYQAGMVIRASQLSGVERAEQLGITASATAAELNSGWMAALAAPVDVPRDDAVRLMLEAADHARWHSWDEALARLERKHGVRLMRATPEEKPSE